MALAWLRKLRWAAILGLAALVALLRWGLQIELSAASLATLIGILAITNLAVPLAVQGRDERARRLCFVLVSIDVLVLTGLLALTGGSGNPFALLYLVHVAMAATCLRTWEIGATGLLCCAGYGGLHYFRDALPMMHHSAVCGPALNYSLHLQGMLMAFVVTTAGISFFVQRLNQELRRRGEELAFARERAERGERFASMATLAAGVAHEIGSPLGTIVVAAGELRRAAGALPEAGTLLEDADLIVAEAARCRAVLDRMAQEADEAPDSSSAVPVSDAVLELGNHLSIRESARLVVDAPASLPAVHAPMKDLAQALAVLVNNACTASPEGMEVRLRARAAGSVVCFEIEDQGTGMSPEELKHAGEPFYTTKEPGKGTGLGLFLVRLLADRVHGRFELTSWPGRGTTARLEIPIARG